MSLSKKHMESLRFKLNEEQKRGTHSKQINKLTEFLSNEIQISETPITV